MYLYYVYVTYNEVNIANWIQHISAQAIVKWDYDLCFVWGFSIRKNKTN